MHGGGAPPALAADAPRRGDAQRGEALLELLGRLAVEGQQQDAAGVHAARHQLGDPAHERLGLARAGGREDARRAAPVFDGGALRGVEPHFVGGGRGGRRGLAPGATARCSRRARAALVARPPCHPRAKYRARPAARRCLRGPDGRMSARPRGRRANTSRGERKPDAVGETASHQRVDEPQQYVVGPGEQAPRRCRSRATCPPVRRAPTAPCLDALLAGVVEPRATPDEARAGKGRRGSPREVSAARSRRRRRSGVRRSRRRRRARRDRAAGPRGRAGGGRIVIGLVVESFAGPSRDHRVAGGSTLPRAPPATDASRRMRLATRVTKVDVVRPGGSEASPFRGRQPRRPSLAFRGRVRYTWGAIGLGGRG